MREALISDAVGLKVDSEFKQYLTSVDMPAKSLSIFVTGIHIFTLDVYSSSCSSILRWRKSCFLT